ncbi:alpha/beta fold hydrolase [Actinocrispum sp. NPDC049592]|uniref:alpha/beta fold hydrolase n=1 Tax=Actinocrispum sp. NPDC049592 TaxID=3154835 RepID=UPI0034337B35
MPTLTVNGVPISYSDTGPRDAPVVLFGHGFLFSGWVFHPQIAALRDRYRCVAIDWRGQGGTPATATGYDMDTLTADAIGLIENLDLAPVHWVGLSMGGFVGMRIAARQPALIRSLILLDTSAGPEEPGKVGQYKLLGLVQQLTGPGPVMGQVKKAMFGPAFLRDPASKPLIDTWVTQIRAQSRTGIRKALRGVTDRLPIEDEIPAITAPTLIAVGAEDVSTPPDKAKRIAELIPGARLEIIPDSGHTSPLEQPARITALLEEFLARNSS